jgi:hypothetical protein
MEILLRVTFPFQLKKYFPKDKILKRQTYVMVEQQFDRFAKLFRLPD